jgi:hypothetical protein
MRDERSRLAVVRPVYLAVVKPEICKDFVGVESEYK